MTETVVHVTTLEQWKSVLDVWFKQGYEWMISGCTYAENNFEEHGSRQLGLVDDGGKYICYWRNNNYNGDNLIEYSEFMAQQKEDNKMETYYVTQEQLDSIQELKDRLFPLNVLFTESNRYQNIKTGLSSPEEKALLRYLGGDTSIKFKVKEPSYRLWLIDDFGNKLFFWIDDGRPDWTTSETGAFTAPLEEIKKWQTPAWEIEKAD